MESDAQYIELDPEIEAFISMRQRELATIEEEALRCEASWVDLGGEG